MLRLPTTPAHGFGYKLSVDKFMIGFTLVLVIDLIITFTEIAFGYNVSWDAYITIVFLVATMAHLGHYGLTQSTVFLPQFLIEDIENQSTSVKSNSTYLKPSEKEELRSQFTRSMQEEKMYLSPDLSSKSLATAMKTSERKLSAFFSEVLDSNFYDTINSYRVEEAKRVLQSRSPEEPFDKRYRTFLWVQLEEQFLPYFQKIYPSVSPGVRQNER